MFFGIILVALFSNGNPQIKAYNLPPTPPLRQRYVAIEEHDTLSFLLLQHVDIQQFDSAGLAGREPMDNFIGDYGMIHASLIPYDSSGIFTIQRPIFVSPVTYDTLFIGMFSFDYDTLRGTLKTPNLPSRKVSFIRDPSYIDQETLTQDSLLKAFQIALSRGDRNAIADCMEYPVRLDLRGTNHKFVILKNKKQFLSHFSQIFTYSFIRRILQLQAPFFQHDGFWGMGAGTLWDGGKWQSNPPHLSIVTINE